MVKKIHAAVLAAMDLPRQWLFRMVERFRIGPQLFLILLATTIGALTGLGAVCFLLLIRLFRGFFFGVLYSAMAPAPYLIFLLPALGGLLIGPLIHFFPKEAKGDGVPAAMETIALGGGIIKPRTVALRTITAAITIGSGGSVGREAPIAQIGAAVGSMVGQLLRVSGERMRNLVGCGAAGGIAAVFNAPMGGVFFALEVLLGDFSAQTFPLIVIASVAAVSVSRAILGNVLIFSVPTFALESFPQIVFCGILGAACGAIAQLFIRSLDATEHKFSSSKIPVWLRAAVGGGMTGIIAIGFPQVLGIDDIALDQALHGALPWTFLLAIGFLKIAATSFSLGSGGSGGVLGPSLFIGGTIGALAGTAANALFPGVAGSVGGYTLIGMAAFLAPMVGAPLTAILILFEITGDYEIILPLLVAVINAMLVSGAISRFSLYTHHLHKKGVDLVRGREEGVLKTLMVRDVMRKEVLTIPSSASFRQLSARFLKEHLDYFYLIDSDGALNGVVSFRDIRPYLMEEGLWDLVRVKDIATSNPVSVTPGESLFDVLIKFGYKNVAILPVIDDPHSRKLIGIIHRKEVLGAYQRRIMSSKRGE
ncbi:MAG: chloride channel protein [Deltaproteobacteria bacterium]|nr:MAG: chloride channel protein [Deltaproteobacteria bacterium]